MEKMIQELGSVASHALLLLALSTTALALWSSWLVARDAWRTVRSRYLRRWSRPTLSAALAEYRRGEVERAYLALSRLLRRQPGDHEAALAMWEIARDAGHPRRAALALLTAIRQRLSVGDTDGALRHWRELVRSGDPAKAEPGLLLEVAGLLGERRLSGAAIQALRTALDSLSENDLPRVGPKVARAALRIDPETAEEAAWKALGSPSLELEDRFALETLLTELYPAGSDRASLELLDEEDLVPTATPQPPQRPQLPARTSQPPRDERRDPEPVRRQSVATARVLDALGLGFDARGLVIEVPGVGKKRVRYDRVEALGVAATRGVDGRPLVSIDLVLNWHARSREDLKIVRLRSDRLDLPRFAPSDTLPAWLAHLLARSGAVALPSPTAAQGRPFAFFDDLHRYETEVLRVARVVPG